MRTKHLAKRKLLCGVAVCAMAINALAPIAKAVGESNSNDNNTTTPIKHVIVIIGENGNDRAILVQGDEGPAQIVRLGHRGTPSIDVSDEIAILAARPIASLRWGETDSKFQFRAR